ncbi:hypothetical protein SUDANB120_05484 [Streptomyces sp. enrichment culture]|uniref:hypothetical protein n=1 Tax=Streptomyces TaxID=1883 RepID=UPI0019A493E1|nr:MULTISPECIES: hypothetical protein [Streptomyces]GGS81749.1 hypothetical protein GCM10010286_02900 [Streptomyces toxytricini]
MDVRSWLDRKWAAIRAHRSETVRARSLPALLSGIPRREREAVPGTEWFIRHDLDAVHRGLRELVP